MSATRLSRPPQLQHELEQRDDQHHERDHHRAEVQQEQLIAALEVDPGERIAAEDRRDDLADDDRHRDEHRVRQRPAEILLGDHLGEVLEPRAERLLRRGEVHQGHDRLSVALQRLEPPTDGEPLAEHLDLFAVHVEQVDRLVLAVDDGRPVGFDAIVGWPGDDHGRIVDAGELGDRHVVLGERELAVSIRQHVHRCVVEPAGGIGDRGLRPRNQRRRVA